MILNHGNGDPLYEPFDPHDPPDKVDRDCAICGLTFSYRSWIPGKGHLPAARDPLQILLTAINAKPRVVLKQPRKRRP